MKDNLSIGLFGISLFLLVLAVIYSVVFIVPNNIKESFFILTPLIVFSGFFIFLIAAVLVSLAIYNRLR